MVVRHRQGCSRASRALRASSFDHDALQVRTIFLQKSCFLRLKIEKITWSAKNFLICYLATIVGNHENYFQR